MNVGIYQAAAALDANSRYQEIMADNLASANVAGYKRRDLAVSSVKGGSLPAGGAPTQPFSAYFSLPKAEQFINFEQGESRFTGSPNDVALSGPGFFEVQLSNRTVGYTRGGEFRISPQGVLTTKNGYNVLGEGGATIQLDRNNPSPMSISSTGEVSQGKDIKGRLVSTEFGDPSKLRPIGGGYFMADDPKAQPAPSPTTVFTQAYLETANTSATQEMANLITSMRLYETNQRVIQQEDQRLDRTIRELAGPN